MSKIIEINPFIVGLIMALPLSWVGIELGSYVARQKTKHYVEELRDLSSKFNGQVLNGFFSRIFEAGALRFKGVYNGFWFHLALHFPNYGPIETSIKDIRKPQKIDIVLKLARPSSLKIKFSSPSPNRSSGTGPSSNEFKSEILELYDQSSIHSNHPDEARRYFAPQSNIGAVKNLLQLGWGFKQIGPRQISVTRDFEQKTIKKEFIEKTLSHMGILAQGLGN